MTGYVKFAGEVYTNSYAPDGKTIRVVSCLICQDTGIRTDSDGRRWHCFCTLTWPYEEPWL